MDSRRARLTSLARTRRMPIRAALKRRRWRRHPARSLWPPGCSCRFAPANRWTPGRLSRETISREPWPRTSMSAMCWRFRVGPQVTGRIVDVKKPGELKGGASIALQLTTLNLGGNSYSLATDTFDTSSPGKGGYTAGNTVGAAALGAVIGAIAGGGPGAAIGAVAGTGVGLGASAATPGPRSVVPAEAVLTFHLTTPATVQPVSYQEAAQLEQSSQPVGSRYPPPPYGYGPGYGPDRRLTHRRLRAMRLIHMRMATRIRMPTLTLARTCTPIRTTTAAGDKPGATIAAPISEPQRWEPPNLSDP